MAENKLLELVTWADIQEGDRVWSMGSICTITRARFRMDNDYDRTLRPGIYRFTHRSESGTEFSPPFELDKRVARLVDR